MTGLTETGVATGTAQAVLWKGWGIDRGIVVGFPEGAENLISQNLQTGFRFY